MKWWHRHVWREYERTWAPPLKEFKAKNLGAILAQQVMFGVTTFVFRCECGAMKTVEALGAVQAMDPLEKMVKP